VAKNKNVADSSIFGVFGKRKKKVKCMVFINIIPIYIYRLVCDLGHKLEHLLCNIFMYQQLPPVGLTLLKVFLIMQRSPLTVSLWKLPVISSSYSGLPCIFLGNYFIKCAGIILTQWLASVSLILCILSSTSQFFTQNTP
jgi:hypothetical protein